MIDFKKYKPLIDSYLKIVLAILIVGLFFSNALKSISIVLLSVGFLLHENWQQKSKELLKNSLFISVIIIAIVYLISGATSQNSADAFEAIKDKLAYFFIPITLHYLWFNKKEKIAFIFLFGVCSLIQTMYAMLFFIQNKTESEHLYSVGNVLPVLKIHHVQIAVLIAITVVLLISVLFMQVKKSIQFCAIILASWLFIFLHIFAVRTGIVLLYFMLIIYLGIQLVVLKKWKIIMVSCLFFCGFLVAFYNFSSTLKNKIDYMKYDLMQYKNNAKDAFQYSDSRRILSIKNGFLILQKYPVFGCGVGDIKDECAAIYKQQNPQLETHYFYLPHNQYVYFLAGFGFIFGCILIVCFCIPLFYFFYNKNYLFASMYSGLLLFGIWDAFLGTLFGNCIYLLIIGFGIKKNEHNSTY